MACIAHGWAESKNGEGHKVRQTNGLEKSKDTSRAHDKSLTFEVLLCYGFKSAIIDRGAILKSDTCSLPARSLIHFSEVTLSVYSEEKPVWKKKTHPAQCS